MSPVNLQIAAESTSIEYDIKPKNSPCIAPNLQAKIKIKNVNQRALESGWWWPAGVSWLVVVKKEAKSSGPLFLFFSSLPADFLCSVLLLVVYPDLVADGSG